MTTSSVDQKDKTFTGRLNEMIQAHKNRMDAAIGGESEVAVVIEEVATYMELHQFAAELAGRLDDMKNWLDASPIRKVE